MKGLISKSYCSSSDLSDSSSSFGAKIDIHVHYIIIFTYTLIRSPIGTDAVFLRNFPTRFFCKTKIFFSHIKCNVVVLILTGFPPYFWRMFFIPLGSQNFCLVWS